MTRRSVTHAIFSLERTYPHAARGTQLLLTEQGAFLDGYDDAGSRERGTAELLDRVGRSLETADV